MQWQAMDWPIMVDSLNLLGVSAVPITLFIDENGVIRKVGPDPDELDSFLTLEVEPASLAESSEQPGNGVYELRDAADEMYLWKSPDALDEVIRLYRLVSAEKSTDPETYFRLGVALRRRYESDYGRREDFMRAVEAWGSALELDPNQYIWRRRIQQYGPRLEKPYPFYDWVQRARDEISSRGQVPVALPVEPGGAEFAKPTKVFVVDTSVEEPDPKGRIVRDSGLVSSEVVSVPARIWAGDSVRFHVSLRPDPARKAHWNNEVEDLKLWVAPPEGWSVDRNGQGFPNPAAEVSQETRTVEFEMSCPAEASGQYQIPAYALYYVCEDVKGTCLYRRLDISLPLTVVPQ
jgi:hypothetical protein